MGIAGGSPDGILLVLLTALLVLDLLTGVTKSVLAKKAVTSRGFRQTLVKFIQYGSALMIGIVLSIMAEVKSMGLLEQLVPYLNDGMASFIIYIEIVSILENLIEMNAASKITRIVFKPLHKIITFQFNQIEKGPKNEEA